MSGTTARSTQARASGKPDLAGRPTGAGVPTRRLLEFACWCLLIGWIPMIAIAVVRADPDHGPGFWFYLLGTSSPSLAALLMWLRYRAERRSRQVRATWTWPLAAVALGALPPVVTAVVLHIGDLSAIPNAATATAASVGGWLGALAYTFISGPPNEEFGWRGYVQPRLRRRVTPVVTVLVLGCVWTLWHLPMFFIAGTSQHEKGLLSVDGLLFLVTNLAIAAIMLLVTEALSGGIPAAILVHAAWNGSTALMPPLGNEGRLLQTGLYVAAAVLSLTMHAAITRRHRPHILG